MADRKAVNRYYPPDFDPTKHGSINKYRNSHPLRERAKRLSEGILIIRFEMPYNIWCGGCGKHIGMGVRYNAEKTKVGNYYSTPIYRFRMKCHLCSHYFEMETNPMECDYTIVTGASRKNQKWDMAENEQVLTEDRQTVKKLASDPMFKLEHGVDDTKKLEAVAPTLYELEQTQTSWKDDFDQNRLLREKFRTEKKVLKSAIAKDEALLSKSSLAIKLVPEHEEDKKLASLMKYNAVETSDEKQKKKRLEISNRSIFLLRPPQSSSTPAAPSETSPSSPPKEKEGKIAQVRQRLGLRDRLRAAKRGRSGFDDFGSSSDGKITRHDRPAGIVVPKRQKETGGGLESVTDCSDGAESSQDVRKPIGDGGLGREVPALRGTMELSEASHCHAHLGCTSSVENRSLDDRDLDRERQTGDGHSDEESATPGTAGGRGRLPVDSVTVKPQQQPDGNLTDHRKRTGQIRNSHETIVPSAADMVEPCINGDREVKALAKPLVSCDYSSSDSDE